MPISVRQSVLVLCPLLEVYSIGWLISGQTGEIQQPGRIQRRSTLDKCIPYSPCIGVGCFKPEIAGVKWRSKSINQKRLFLKDQTGKSPVESVQGIDTAYMISYHDNSYIIQYIKYPILYIFTTPLTINIIIESTTGNILKLINRLRTQLPCLASIE